MSVDAIQLSAEERKDLQALEEVVEEGIKTFLEVGAALSEIRDRELYRAEYETFHEYCRDRWGFGRHYAYRQIRASATVQTLCEVANWQRGGRIPRNEAQARPLAPLDDEETVKAWRVALQLADGSHPTASIVEEAVNRVAEGQEPEGAVHFSSETNEWLTPPKVLERVVDVLGAVDLDPCSDGAPDPNVPASSHFTENENGLTREWFGRVFMNPPYGQEVAEWVEKLIVEFEAGRVQEAVALLPARTDTAWFRSLRPYPRCFLHGRLKFSGHENSAPFPSMTVYFGEQAGRFTEAFTEVGDVYVAVQGTERWRG